jgi:hypothetical protein
MIIILAILWLILPHYQAPRSPRITHLHPLTSTPRIRCVTLVASKQANGVSSGGLVQHGKMIDRVGGIDGYQVK